MNDIIKNSEAIIVLGSRISLDKPELLNSIKDSSLSQFVYMHPIDDKELENLYTQFIKYEVGSEEGVVALLASFLISAADEKTMEYLEDLDIGYISGESSVGEEELEELVENFSSKTKKTLIIGDDIIKHSRSENIFKLVSIIKKYTDFEVILLSGDDIALEVDDMDEVEDIDTYNGTVIYNVKDSSTESIKGSKAFAMAARIQPGDTINISYADQSIVKKFELDQDIKGTVALYPIVNDSDLLSDGYRFKQVKISKVEG